MRSYLLPLALSLSFAAAGAMAATTTNGVIKSMDAKAHTVTLADGSVYVLPKTIKAGSMKVGEKVAIIWNQKGNAKDATKVTVVK